MRMSVNGSSGAGSQGAGWRERAGFGCHKLKSSDLHHVFLKSKAVKHWESGDGRKLVCWHANSGAHGVTRPTAQWQATGQGVFELVFQADKRVKR